MKKVSNLGITFLNIFVIIIFLIILNFSLNTSDKAKQLYDIATRSNFFSRLALKISTGTARSSTYLAQGVFSKRELDYQQAEDLFLGSYSNYRILLSDQQLLNSQLSSEFLHDQFEDIKIDFEELLDKTHPNYLHTDFAKEILIKTNLLSKDILAEESRLWINETTVMRDLFGLDARNKFFVGALSFIFVVTQLFLFFVSRNRSSLVKKNQEQNIQLIRQTRLSTLGTLSAELAHEINSPLMVIDGRIKLMEQTIESANPDLNKIKNNLDIVKRNSNRIQSIIRSFKTMANDGSNDSVELVNLNDIFKDVVEIVTGKAKRHRVNIVPPNHPTPVIIIANKVQLVQVITNIVSNAIFAVKELEERWVKLEYETNSEIGKVKISITDSGAGIPPEVAEKMFLTFYSTKASTDGTGLGLSISKKIIEKHNGELIYNPECPNTQFVITLSYQK